MLAKQFSASRVLAMDDRSKPLCAIVGAGPSNGAALASRFSQAGFRTALLARDIGRLEAMAASIPHASAIQCDIADVSSVETAFAAVNAKLGPVDTLIFNAGKVVRGDALSVSIEDFEAAWRLNTLGAFISVRQVLPSMLKAGAGTIIIVGATASRRGSAGTAAFGAAKAGQRSLAESLARAYGPRGVHVALIVIDAVVDEPAARARLSDRPDDFFCAPADVAETAYMLANQARSAWTFELEVRPFAEVW